MNSNILRSKRGFTLIELLVVIAIIGILATLILIALNAARARARDARVISNVEQAFTICTLRQDVDGDYTKCVVDDTNLQTDEAGAISRLDVDTKKIDGIGSATEGGITIPAGTSHICLEVTLNAKAGAVGGATNKLFCRDDQGFVSPTGGGIGANCSTSNVCTPGT